MICQSMIPLWWTMERRILYRFLDQRLMIISFLRNFLSEKRLILFLQLGNLINLLSIIIEMILGKSSLLISERDFRIWFTRLAAKAGVTMDRNNTDDRPGITVENLPNGHYKYTLPIPLSEIAGNPNIQ